jgi:menaquinone-dependent protoporphyrinogen oxidase
MEAIVIFDSKHGTTADLASRIAEKLGEGVRLVYLRDKGATGVALDDCDLVVLGGPVYAGRWSARATAFAREREAELAGKTFAFFSCGTVKEEGTASAVASLPPKLAAAAVASAKLGGAIRWESMNFLERIIVKAVSGKSGDMSMIDFAAVDAFAVSVAEAANKGK